MYRTTKYLLSACVLATGLALSGMSGQAQEVTLKLHTFIPPPANPYRTFLKPWAERIAKASGGKLKIQLFPVMQLGGKPPQLPDQVKDGVVDLVWTLPGFTPGRFPRIEVFELPFVHTSPLATTLALQDYQEKHLKGEFKDYKVLLLHCHAGTMFMTKKNKPILKMADLKGVKLRTATRVGGWHLEAMGAVAIGAPLPRIPQMLSKGVIDGAMLPFEIAPAVKMQDLTANFSQLEGNQPRVSTATFALLMNKASYNKLPPALKKVIDDNSGRNIAEWAGKNWADIEAPGRKVVASKKKNKFHTIPAAEVAKIKAAAKPAIERWIKEVKAKGIDGAVLLKDARALLAKYSK
jgi:TRAP-type C4-dicarboxylate transport system substrate-binding protein